MSKFGSEFSPLSLGQLLQRLNTYANALAEWRQAIDDANEQIAGLTPDQAQLVLDEIIEVQTNQSEYLALKKRVDEGWRLYRQLAADVDIKRQPGRALN